MIFIKDIYRSIKGVGKLLAFVGAIAMAFSSCSTDDDFDNVLQGEGDIVIRFAIPDLQTVLTRATSETEVKSVDAFLFTEGEEFIAKNNYSITPQLAQQKILLRVGGAYSNTDVIIYLVANGGEGVGEINSLEELRQYLLSASLNDPETLPMIGRVKVNTSEAETSLTLTRSVAKVSAECGVENTELKGIRIYSDASQGFLASPLNQLEYDNLNYVIASGINNSVPSYSDFENQANHAYAYPSYGFNYNSKSGAYAIVKVNRDNEDQYYRLNLRKEKTDKESSNEGYIDNELIYLNLFANHHYKIKITGFFTSGYSSAEEAAKHPESDQFIVYNIHDHAMEVLSMVTDGYNELGVTPEVTLTSSIDVKTIVVKCYSPDKVVTDQDIEVESPEWLDVSYSGPHKFKYEEGETESGDSENAFVPDYDERWDHDNPGQQFEYTVKIAGGAREYEDLIGEISFKWNGLERKVKVDFEAAFLLPDVCTVTLQIFKDGTSLDAEIKDYWTFVTAQGESGEKNGTATSAEFKGQTPRLFGIKPQNLVGNKKRMNGFHFPMPYGEHHSTQPWTYVYTVDFTNLTQQPDIESKNTTINNISIERTGDSYFVNNVSWNYSSGNSGELTFSQATMGDQYQYGGGTITFTISYADGSDSKINASLYHTGFFHYEGSTEYAPENKTGYYYYEVVPMGDGYWLDRNIGAEANISYIDIEDPQHKTGAEAAGRHYTIIEEPQNFQLPKWDFKMIPPGYHVPNQTEWDALRLSDDFVTQSVTLNSTLYMATYYRTNNNKIGNIYFQKARFRNSKNLYTTSPKYNEEANSGDAGAGYYWTVSEAPAMEKEQMGNWLRALYLNGSSSTYNNASVTDHRMPIRCKAGTDKEQSTAPEHYISFNVHEATHVFLYHTETLTPLYTFPGRSIGSSASAVKWQHFYCSTTQNPDNLKMIFVKIQEDGKVVLHYKDGNSFKTTQEYDKIDLKNQGWDIETGKYYDFCEVGQGRDHNVLVAADDFTGKDYPTDCVTNNSGGTGGGGFTGEIQKGNFIWEGSYSNGDNWGQCWEYLSDERYDWKSIEEGKKVTLYVEFQTYWENFQLRLYHRLPGWDRIPDTPEYTRWWKDNWYKGDKIWMTFEIELTSNQIKDLQENGGLMLFGYNMEIGKVTLTIE